MDDADRCLLEYFLRDAYREYGYEFHYYHGEPADMDWVREKLKGIRTLDGLIEETVRQAAARKCENGVIVLDSVTYQGKEGAALVAQKKMEDIHKDRLEITELLMKGLTLVNSDNQPLHFMKKLELDPALLEQPLYH